jgi:ribosomal protein L29
MGSWWDKQDLDPTARQQYEQARKDEYFNQRIQSRVDALEKEGRFNNATGMSGSAGL